MPPRVKAGGGPNYISIKLGVEPVYDSYKSTLNQRRRRIRDRDSLTPNSPVFLFLFYKLLH